MERSVKRRRSRDHHNDSSTKWAHLPYLGLEPGALAFDAHVDDIGSKTRQSKFQALNDWLKKKNTSDYRHITDTPKYWNAVLDPPELNLIIQRAFHEDRPAMEVVLNVCRAQGRSFEETKREVLRVEIEQRMRRQMLDIQQFGMGLLHSERALDYALECKAANDVGTYSCCCLLCRRFLTLPFFFKKVDLSQTQDTGCWGSSRVG